MSASPERSLPEASDATELGERIRSARIRSGLSQRELARRLGVSPGAVGQWELGVHSPSRSRLSVLAKTLRVQVEWLLQTSPRMANRFPAETDRTDDLRLLDEARHLGVDLHQVVAEARQRRWLEENREAINDANAFLERFGLWSDGRRLF